MDEAGFADRYARMCRLLFAADELTAADLTGGRAALARIMDQTIGELGTLVRTYGVPDDLVHVRTMVGMPAQRRR